MVLDHGMASGFHGYGSAVQVPIHEHVGLTRGITDGI